MASFRLSLFGHSIVEESIGEGVVCSVRPRPRNCPVSSPAPSSPLPSHPIPERGQGSTVKGRAGQCRRGEGTGHMDCNARVIQTVRGRDGVCPFLPFRSASLGLGVGVGAGRGGGMCRGGRGRTGLCSAWSGDGA